MAYTNIDDPSAYFQVATYTGNNNDDRQVTNDGNSDLKPDWVWLKDITQAQSHAVFDSTRGATKRLQPNTTGAESTEAATLKSFTTDGFTLGTSATVNNGSNPDQYVAWQWKANGGTTTSKSSGTVAGNVTTPCVQQVNTDAGFSILTYTASTSYAGTETHLEHGLGVGPKVLIVKRRDTTGNWNVYHAGNGASPNAGYGYLLLNTTNATQVASPSNQYWLNTPAESNATLLALGAENGANGGQYVCYAFAEKQGYSKFGKYAGNGHSGGDGTFVYTGFAPSFIIIKRIDSAQDWNMHTYKLGTLASSGSVKGNVGNLNNAALQANEAGVVDEWGAIDMLSNGFKIRTDSASENANGGTYVYMAFADHPFVTSTGIPTTAR